ncbi:MAG: ribosome silencing factor [Candidatus Fimenecus sp.]
MEETILLKKLVAAVDKFKGGDITVLNIKDVSTVADYFIIATATSTTHLKSLADNIFDTLKRDDSMLALAVEGKARDWQLLDYGTVVVHLFTDVARERYNLEKLWIDAKKIEIKELI